MFNSYPLLINFDIFKFLNFTENDPYILQNSDQTWRIEASFQDLEIWEDGMIKKIPDSQVKVLVNNKLVETNKFTMSFDERWKIEFKLDELEKLIFYKNISFSIKIINISFQTELRIMDIIVPESLSSKQ